MSSEPNIIVSTDDYQRINALLDSLPDSEASERLINELERAEVVDSDLLPGNVVAMHSRVTFTVLSTKKTFTYKLVYPNEVLSKEMLSILSPVGSAILGLSVGSEIVWPLEGGKSTRVRIDAILE